MKFRKQRIAWSAALFTSAVLFYTFYVKVITPANHALNESLCRSNLAKLRSALFFYDGNKGSLPPAYVLGADGKPAHSWRALIMPYLDSLDIDADAFNAAYDFTQPWDESKNAKLVKPVRDSRFACQCGTERGTTYTSYVVLTGENTLFPGTKSVSLSAIPKGQDPILVVEITHSDIVWTQPRDLALNSLGTDASRDSLNLSPSHGNVIRYITVGGRIETLPADTPLDQLRRLAELPPN